MEIVGATSSLQRDLTIDTGTADITEDTGSFDDPPTDSKELEERVLSLVSGTSERFVPKPSLSLAVNDAVNGLGDFKRKCRWKEFWLCQKHEKIMKEQMERMAYYHTNPHTLSEAQWNRAKTDPNWVWPDPQTGKDYEDELHELQHQVGYQGLGTGLKPEHASGKAAPLGSPQLEAFLKNVEEEILRRIIDKNDMKEDTEHETSVQAKEIVKDLAKSGLVVVPTDKTNTFRTMTKEQYVREIMKHLDERAVEINREQLMEIFNASKVRLDDAERYLSEGEHAFLKEKIDSKALPSPKILIKDHKAADEQGCFPTRLVIPATNFTAGFSKLGYMSIKRLLDQYSVNYTARTIVQASDLKEKLEQYDLSPTNCTITSVDAEAMYPSIKIDLIEKAIKHYTSEMSQDDLETIEGSLSLVKAGMASTLVSFEDRFYLYDGDLPLEQKGLTIGGYESAWLADLVMAFILDTMDESVQQELHFLQFYRDDGIGVFKGTKTATQVEQWLSSFQDEVDRIAGNNFLRFTADVWVSSKQSELKGDTTKLSRQIKVHDNDQFPFLDMQLSWKDVGDGLIFGVYLKPNQELKYLNKGSAHTPDCFKAINTGVFNRLAKLTSLNESNSNKQLDVLYPHHFEALRNAQLVDDRTFIPTLRQAKEELLDDAKRQLRKDKKKRQERDRKRAIYFKIGVSNYWSVPIHKIIKDIKKAFPTLSWLRVSMSYHRFPNIRELFQGDLNTKLVEGVNSLDYMDRPCNCRVGKTNCPYMGKCRQRIVVYKATCLQTNKVYIGNTSQHVKTRIQQHIRDTKDLVCKGKRSDSFAYYFSKLVPPDTPRKEVNQHVKLKIDILWKGNPLAVVKTFGTNCCKLCAKERLEILKLTRRYPDLAINKCSEIYGSCRHKPKFHRFNQEQNASTDESGKDERVGRPLSTTSTNSQMSAFSSSDEVYVNETREPTVSTEQGWTFDQRDANIERLSASLLTARMLAPAADIPNQEEVPQESNHPYNNMEELVPVYQCENV